MNCNAATVQRAEILFSVPQKNFPKNLKTAMGLTYLCRVIHMRPRVWHPFFEILKPKTEISKSYVSPT